MCLFVRKSPTLYGRSTRRNDDTPDSQWTENSPLCTLMRTELFLWMGGLSLSLFIWLTQTRGFTVYDSYLQPSCERGINWAPLIWSPFYPLLTRDVLPCPFLEFSQRFKGLGQATILYVIISYMEFIHIGSETNISGVQILHDRNIQPHCSVVEWAFKRYTMAILYLLLNSCF